MKKLGLLFLTTLVFMSCSIEDDGPQIRYEFAEVLSADLPEAFEVGKTYQIDITYLLPTACHVPAGLDAKRGSGSGEERRSIFVAGVASYDGGTNECTEEGEEEERTEEDTFSLTIDEEGTYTFYLWIGVNEEMENQYTVVEVPVETPTPGDE